MGEPTDRHGSVPASAGGVRREVKHLSTCRKGYSVSSGGSDGPAGSCRKPCVRGTGLNTGPQRVRAPYLNAHGLSIASPK